MWIWWKKIESLVTKRLSFLKIVIFLHYWRFCFVYQSIMVLMQGRKPKKNLNDMFFSTSRRLAIETKMKELNFVYLGGNWVVTLRKFTTSFTFWHSRIVGIREQHVPADMSAAMSGCFWFWKTMKAKKTATEKLKRHFNYFLRLNFWTHL